jgi:PilZ domain
MITNRRAHARHPITRPYVAHLLSSTGYIVTVAVPADISRGGFRTDVTGEYCAGDRLVLELQNPHPLRGYRFPFVVVWSKSSPGAEIGGAFAAEITEAESKALASG